MEVYVNFSRTTPKYIPVGFIYGVPFLAVIFATAYFFCQQVCLCHTLLSTGKVFLAFFLPPALATTWREVSAGRYCYGIRRYINVSLCFWCSSCFLPLILLPPPLVPAGSFEMDSSIDRRVLIELFRTTNGPSWGKKDSWDTNATISSWVGVTTDEDGFVVRLDLPANGLEGETSPALLGSQTATAADFATSIMLLHANMYSCEALHLLFIVQLHALLSDPFLSSVLHGRLHYTWKENRTG